MMNKGKELREYPIWSKTTRWFHWINFVCVLLLVSIGTVILNGSTLGLGGEGKVLLKELHVLVGYLFLTNLAWRLTLAFFGNKNSRWRSLLPGGLAELTGYLRDLRRGQPPTYLGHNPLGRLMVSLLLTLLVVQGTTGLVLAGTDIYFPPFGNQIAEWVTNADPEKMARLEPGSKEFVDPEMYKEMRAFRKPFINTHLYSFYILLVALLVHIIAVVVMEVRERNGIVSAMFTGKKVLRDTPVDLGKAELEQEESR
jgi:Ni/Fe-hydrogenase 1 B-type cytochrome subunit